MYDAIIVGARCAGSPTAMLLAQYGYKVLLVDKATFPSDIISTHIIWPPGTARLNGWGLLDKIAATDCPLIAKLTFDVGDFALSGSLPPYDGTSDCYAPRRTELDKVLVDAAAEAGVEVRENCPVDEIIMDGDRVTGVRCTSKGESPVTENARVVIGADGRNSIVARAVDATKYSEKPTFACWYYAYWSGVPVNGIEFYLRPELAIGYIPTNGGQVCLPISAKYSEFDTFRSDIEGSYLKALESAPELLERVRAGKRESQFFGTGDVPNFFRKPYGPGWALAGDAGYHKDPIGAQGISDAFRDAERLAAALDEGFSGRGKMDESLARYEQDRNDEAMAMYEFNCEMASHEQPPPEMLKLFSSLRANQADTNRFLGTLAGTVPVPEFFSPENTQRIIALAAS
ncbi:MAG: NAD(P)/FAD-dependent oxidoreductase [Pyrinomonadaceae bacterium]